MEERKVLHEITPLMGKDVLYIADRHKKEFTYPIHNHEVFELNFVEHAPGVRRIVGDSSEVIGEYELVLITSPDLEHVWEQHECKSQDIREITVHFDISMDEDSLFGKTPFTSLRKMMNEARKGLAFPMPAIMKVYAQLNSLSTIKEGFYAVMQFLTILYELSKCDGARTLASTSYAKVAVEDDSRRILKVKNYISTNFMDEMRLATLADIAISDWAMPPACSSTHHAAPPKTASTAGSTTSAISTASSRRRKAAAPVSSVRAITKPRCSFNHLLFV